jgi:ATP-dependent RNA helicase DDX47/RRP3
MLRTLEFGAVPMHGKMSQSKRVASVNKFKAGQRSIVVATDVASRGLHMPRCALPADAPPSLYLIFSSVDLVINFEIPRNSKDCVHRVGDQGAEGPKFRRKNG